MSLTIIALLGALMGGISGHHGQMKEYRERPTKQVIIENRTPQSNQQITINTNLASKEEPVQEVKVVEKQEEPELDVVEIGGP